MKQRRSSPERAVRRDVMKQADAVAAAFKGFRPASEVLVLVRAVQTIFPQFDKATRVGGLPIERFTLLHGESAGGKSYFAIAMMLSFLLLGHFVLFIDAELTTPIAWLRKAMGKQADNRRFFAAEPPHTFEKTVKRVRDFLLMVKKLRDEGKVPPETSALIVVDSMRKLVPEGELKRIMSEAKSDKGDVRTRAAQIKALMNAAWLDELVPLLHDTHAGMIAVAREVEDPDAPAPRAIPGRPPPQKKMKVSGGRALFYDASMDLRVSRLRAYGKKTEAGFTKYGDVHKVQITKSKVSGRAEEWRSECLFHVSNGVFTPEGFDRSRDLVELARSLDVIEGTNSLKFGRAKWRSEDKAVLALDADPALFAEIERECRALFKLEETR